MMSALTQHDIDTVVTENEARGLISKAVSHPFLAGGLVLVGAGLAYAAAKTIKSVNGRGSLATCMWKRRS